IKNNQTRDCTVRIEIENSSRIEVRKNTVTENSAGIIVQVLPRLSVTATTDVSITDNVLSSNNRPNPVTDPSDLLSEVPSGVGILNIGGDRVIVKNNEVTQNNSFGIAIAQLPPKFAALDPRVDPFP